MRKIIDINEPSDCPHCQVWRDYCTHKITNITCRIKQKQADGASATCSFDTCPLESVTQSDESRELLMGFMQYLNNPFLGLVQECCQRLGHPADEDDNYKNLWNRCYCREKKYEQRRG